jgi:hypothetical protein
MKPEDELKALEAIDESLFEPDLSILTDEELEFIVFLQEKYEGENTTEDMLNPEERKESERIMKKLKDENRRKA